MAITSSLTIPISLIVVRNMLISDVGWDITGQWQAVWKISEIYLSIITMSLSTYYLPKLSSVERSKDILKVVNNTAIIILPIVIVFALGVYFLRDVIINVLFTGDFKYARELFSIQLTGDVVKILSWLYAFPMLSRGATKWFVSSEIIFSITFVTFSYFAIQYFGAKGVSFAYLINYTLYFLFIILNFNRIIK